MIQSHFEDLRRIKAAKERRDLPLRIIAAETGLAINTIQRVRNATMDRVQLTTLEKLCRYFAVKSLCELIEYSPVE
jgi:DNA-binding Xre family transcriptional regulator